MILLYNIKRLSRFVPFQVRPACVAAFAFALVHCANLAHAQDAALRVESVEVRASFSDAGNRIHGHARYVVHSEGGSARAWVYSARLSHAPSAMDEQSARWIFPQELDLEDTESQIRIDGREIDFSAEEQTAGEPGGIDTRGRDLRFEVPAGRRIIAIEFEYDLPQRYGRLGCVGLVCSAQAPWYPLLLSPGGAPIQAASEHDVRVHYEGERRLTSLRPSREFVGFSLSPEWFRYPIHTSRLDVVVWSPEPLYERPGAEVPAILGLRDLAASDVLGQIAQVVEHAGATLHAADIAPRRAPLRIIMGTSRTELAGNAPGAVLLSDRAFEVSPLDDVQAFHQRALLRAVFRDRIPRFREPTEDAGWARDLRAVLLTDLDGIRREGGVRSAQELLGWAAFHPAIDQLLYAPQVAFVDVFFGGVSEPDPYQDSPDRARIPIASGRRILEGVRDLLSEEEMEAWSRRLLHANAPARASLRAVSPEIAGRLDAILTGPLRSLNYRLGEVETRRDGDGYVHRVHLHRDGDDAHEPVEVRIRAGEDELIETWDSSGAEGVVEFQTSSPIDEIQVDPRRRRVQSARAANGHPYRDDTDSLPWRPPLLQSLNLSTSPVEGAFLGFIDFALARRYDLENRVAFQLYTGPRATGGIIRYTRGVGPKRDNNNRVGAVSTGLIFDRLRADFSEDDIGGWRTRLFLAGTYNTQRYFLDPRGGFLLRGSLDAGVNRRDDGRTTFTLTPVLHASLNVRTGLRGALVLVADLSYAFGDPLVSELPGLGGRSRLRAYPNNAFLGRGRGFVVAEQRFTPSAFSNLSINLFNTVWIREIQLAVFAGAGLSVQPLNRDVDFAGAAEVGGGIRIHFEYGGIQPAVISLDWGVPLVRQDEQLPRVSFVLSFDQYI